MTDNEKLIERLRTTPDTGPASRFLLDRAAAALEDAAKAHTPTDDEREALVDAIDEVLVRWGEQSPSPYEVADGVLAAGFRRTEVPEPSAEPTERTSNFGWAIWHLTKAKAATSVEEAQMHAVAASARAQLQVAAEMGATRGVDPNGPTTWQENWS